MFLWAARWKSNQIITAQQGGKTRYYYRKDAKEFIVTIPPGIKHGQKIRLRGMGGRGKGGAEPGDLYITVHIKKSLRDKIRGLLMRP